MACLIAMTSIKTVKNKLITIGLVILFSFGQGQLNLWKIPARKYITELEKSYPESLKIIFESDSIYSLSYHFSLKVNYQIENIDSSLINTSEKFLLKQFFENTEIIEIEKNRFGTLLIMKRFLDNGSGLLYSTPMQMKEIKEEDRFEINGYDVIDYFRLAENWYFLSFT
jgi:hypothetical protein